MGNNNRPKSKLERLQAKGGVPQSIKNWDKHNSVQAFNTKNNWFNSRLTLLADLQNQTIQIEICRQKELARKAGNLRKARILKNGFEYYTVTQVLLHYGKNCHICDFPIDLKAPRKVGTGEWYLSLHIDHLMLISKGGADTLKNVRPAHAICNLKKGASY